MQVEVVTPERVIYSGESTMVVTRTLSGEVAFLPHHAPFLGALVDRYDQEDAPSNHAPQAAFDDRVLPLGAALYAQLAMSRLAQA